ncbi:monocarboxylate transporter 9 [Parasteatoda tepidariorum]|uniref:monocarboxylate transporter 9 n=1 Tax=Parasteatoda tepidariorum TaxID=114398 RepID=UPI00077FC5E4|nr:monocarboxylate transporter 9 [Parasteatoda tepidariorum]
MAYSEGPDKGHAWVIAFTAGMITMILSGISKMVGILYVAVIDTYQVSRGEATLPFTFRKSLRCLTGPIVGIVGQRYGIRAVTLGGAVIAALGAALSFLAPTVTWLAVCWGGIHGFGEAFANTLFQVVVNQYFEKYRSTASGIAMSGACIGSVFFSFLIEFLRETYGLQGTFLILAGVILHVVPAAMLLKSPSWITNPETKPVEKAQLKRILKNNGPVYSVPSDYIKSNAEKRKSIVSLSPSLLEKNEIMKASNNIMKSHSAANLISTLEKKLENEKGFDNLVFALENEKNETKSYKPALEKQLSFQNLFSTSKENNSTPNSRNLSRQTSLKEDFQKEDIEKKVEDDKKESVLDSIKTIGRLYTNPIYVLACVGMATYVFIFIPIMTSMIDYSQDKGLPDSIGKYLVHTMAVGDIIGRLCFGWVTDKNYISLPHYMILTLVLQGTFLLLLPLASSLWAYLILLAFYAMTAGSMMVRLPVIVLKNVKKEEQSVAMGCVGFASGLVPLGVPSLIGHFRDYFGSYDGMYYLLGGLSILAGGFWVLEPLLVRLNSHLENKKQNNVDV